MMRRTSMTCQFFRAARRGRGPTMGLVLAISFLAGCGSSGANSAAPKPAATAVSASRSAVPTIAGRTGTLQGIVQSTELVVGENRFTIGILGKDGAPLPDAQVHLKFIQLAGAPSATGQAQGTVRSEADATFRAPGREAGLPAVETVIRTDGTRVSVQSVGNDVGVYETTASFDTAGDWGVEADITGKTPDQSGIVRSPFKVTTKSVTPAVGAPAPRSQNLTTSDGVDLSLLDTSAHPTADMHTETIAAAIAAGHPTLVLFATPGYCTSRLCGPELELARKLEPKYTGKADFIHVEIYKEPPPKGTLMPAVEEWHLQSEPWFFVIDRNGNVAAKFEGPTTLEEIDAALQKVTS